MMHNTLIQLLMLRKAIRCHQICDVSDSKTLKKRSYEQLQLQQATVILLVTGQKKWALGKKDLLQKNHCVVAASAWITMDTCSILQP